MADRVPVAFVFGMALVDEVGVLDAMVVDERIAPDVASLAMARASAGVTLACANAGTDFVVAMAAAVSAVERRNSRFVSI